MTLMPQRSMVHPMTTNEPPTNHPGTELRNRRKDAGMSLRAVAAQVGCSASHLVRIESGERPLTDDLGTRITNAIAAA